MMLPRHGYVVVVLKDFEDHNSTSSYIWIGGVIVIGAANFMLTVKINQNLLPRPSACKS